MGLILLVRRQSVYFRNVIMPFNKTQKFIHSRYHVNSSSLMHKRLNIGMGFHKSTSFLSNTQFYVESASIEETLISDPKQISEDAQKICKVLSTVSSNTSISPFLDNLSIKLSPNLVEEVLKKLSNAGMLAYAFFRWAENKEGYKHTTQSFHLIIEALGKIKQFRLVWTLVDSMRKKGLLKKETFGIISRRYARARKLKEAINAFEKMEVLGYNLELSDYNSLIDIMCKSKHVERAQMIFNDMQRRKKFCPDLKTYSILLEGWGGEHNLEKMNQIYKHMIDDGFTPDVVTYGILIRSFCKSGKCDDALKIYHEMERSNCKPSPHIYCTLINGLGSEKRLEEALNFFGVTKTNGFEPELPTYNAVVGSYCRVERFEDAFEIVEEMRTCKIGPNARTYDIILHHLIRAGKKEDAYMLFKTMPCEPQLSTYTMMVGMLCKERRVDMGLQVWKAMEEKGVLPCMHMFCSLIGGLCFENRLDEACGFFKEMLGKGIRPPGNLFGSLKEALTKAGKKDVALELGLELEVLRTQPYVG